MGNYRERLKTRIQDLERIVKKKKENPIIPKTFSGLGITNKIDDGKFHDDLPHLETQIKNMQNELEQMEEKDKTEPRFWPEKV